jgi:peptidoglycan/xylan/chitin deacetylase (PgdA/CDA1 family)
MRHPSRLLAAIAAAAVLAFAASSARERGHHSRTKTPTAAAPPARNTAEAGRERAAIERVLRYTSYISAGSHRHRDVALTFDDGPGPQTPQLLALLRRLHVPATFFQMGRSVGNYLLFAQRELRLGYAIGDHTRTHPFLSRLSAGAQRDEIVGAARQIHAYGAPYPQLFRPPFGAFDARTLRVTRAAHMLMVLWTVDTHDYRQPGAKRIAYTAISGARPGAIILMHDAGGPRGQTLAALPRIVRALRRRHYRLVTVPRLILDDPPPRHQGPPHSLAGR